MKPDTETTTLVTRDFNVQDEFKELMQSQKKLATTQNRINEALKKVQFKLDPVIIPTKVGPRDTDVVEHETETVVTGDINQIKPNNLTDITDYEPMNLVQLDPCLAEAVYNSGLSRDQATLLAQETLGNIMKNNPEILDEPFSQNEIKFTAENRNLIGTAEGPSLPFTAVPLPVASSDDLQVQQSGDLQGEVLNQEVDVVNTRNEAWKEIGVTDPPV
ncbi:hypothetical protein ACF0H5_010006 [Mactra antiquata]